MSVVITELLGTDPFSGSRITINANFTSLANEVNDLEDVFGISLSSGNMDLTANLSGGVLKVNSLLSNNFIYLPATGVPTITLSGATGDIKAETMELSTSASVPTLTADNLIATSLGSSVFNGQATFNKLMLVRDGWALNKVNLGAVSAHTVINDDNVLLYQPTGTSPDSLVLTPDASLVDGHVVTLINTTSTYCTLSTLNIFGFTSIAFSSGAYKSVVTLMYSQTDTKWLVMWSTGMTMS